MKIIVLTSEENFVWHSMQEIIPFIEQTWAGCASENIKVVQLKAEDTNLAQLMREGLGATHVVLTCFNLRVCKLARYLRENLQLPVNFVVYVHNMSTIAFWPFREWGGEAFFRKNDLFITSCENDRRTLQAVLALPRVLTLPFALPGAEIPPPPSDTPRVPGFSHLAYVGRISPQKNLHNLLVAYAQLKQKGLILPPLLLFGREDHLGSPNMGTKMNNYQEFLNAVSARLGLQNEVQFKGFTDRREIAGFLKNNRVLSVSPSLHADENFGMAVFQSLTLANAAVISDWGGHSDFKTYFSSQVELVGVRSSEWGPVLAADDLADCLEKFLTSGPPAHAGATDSYYDVHNHRALLKSGLSVPWSDSPLGFSPLADRILTKKLFFAKEDSESTRIFSDYGDRDFHEISEYYRGPFSRAAARNSTPESAQRWSLVPWVRNFNRKFMIEDPHKGLYVLTDEASELSREIQTPAGPVACGINIFERLKQGGYAVRGELPCSP